MGARQSVDGRSKRSSESLAVDTIRRKMRERPEYRNELGTAEAVTLIDRVTAFREVKGQAD